MSRKNILASIFLIFIGIVFGVVLVSNFRNAVEPAFAGDPQVKIGGASPIRSSGTDYRSWSKACIDVSKAVTPTVVSINVTTKGKAAPDDLNDFFHFFGPDRKAPQPEPQRGSGSGVIISPEGYILTNNHVVEDADEKGIEVVLHDRRRMSAKVIGTDPTTDLAIIKVEGSNLPTAAFGNSDNLEVGEWVLAIGNPLGLRSTVTAGIVSAIGRGTSDVPIIQDRYGIEDFIQTDAAINPGNSGGPLVNLNGEVIGLNAAIATTNARYQGYGFAIPINLARSVAEDLIKHGKVRRGYIGVQIGDVDATMAKALGLDKAQGVVVQRLEPDGAAREAGLREGDVILSVDGKQVDAPNELQSLIARKHPGDEVALKIYREGKTIEKKLTLRSRKEEAVAAKEEDSDKSDSEESETPEPPKATSIDNIGLTVRPLTSSEKKDLSVSEGVYVASSKMYGEAFNRQIRTGDVILEADKQELRSPSDLKAVLQAHKPGDAVLMRVRQKDAQGNPVTSFVAIQIPR